MEDLKNDLQAKKQSRKYRLALIALGVILVGWGVAGFFTSLASMYSHLIAGVLGVLTIYYGGNVANKHIVGKQMVELEKHTSQEAGEKKDGLD
jgi:xanthine/uracil permease